MCVILHYQHQANEKKLSDDMGQSLIRLEKTTSNQDNIIKGQRQTPYTYTSWKIFLEKSIN